MKIVYFLSQNNFFGRVGYGSIAHAIGIISGLIENGYDVVVMADKGISDESYSNLNCEKLILPTVLYKKYFFLFSWVKKNKKNIIIYRKNLDSLFIFYFFNKFFKNQILVSEINGLFFDYTKFSKYKFLTNCSELIHKIFLKKNNLIYSVDEIIQSRLCVGALALPFNKVKVIYNGGPKLNNEFLNFKNNNFQIKLLYFGFISEYSELDVVIEACLLSKTKLDIVGDGPLLNQLISKYGQKKEIKFHGFQNDNYVYDLMRNAKKKNFRYIGVCPYKFGNTEKSFAPIKGFKYLSMGLPVLFSSNSYKNIFIKNLYGFSYPQGSVSGFQNSLKDLTQNYIKTCNSIVSNYDKISWKGRMKEIIYEI